MRILLPALFALSACAATPAGPTRLNDAGQAPRASDKGTPAVASVLPQTVAV